MDERAEPVFFTSEGLEMEALFQPGKADAAVVVCHPHPLYGGDMENPVVEAVARAYAARGYATLRFNFRGVGKSQGAHGNGVDEARDAAAAAAWLRDRGFSRTALAGYSFGTRVLATAAPGLGHPPMLWVAPPVAMMDFGNTGALPGLHTVVVGERDTFAPAAPVRALAGQWNPEARVHVVPGADHFFFHHGAALDRVLAESVPEP